MPHKCMNCGKIYEDEAEELIEGCECGSNLFIYQQEFEEEEYNEAEGVDRELQEKRQDVKSELDKFVENLKDKVSRKTKISFDIQSIRIIEEGVYEVDIAKLLENVPLVVEAKEGEYIVHLASAFKKGDYEGFDLRDIDQEDLEDLKEKRRRQARKRRQGDAEESGVEEEAETEHEASQRNKNKEEKEEQD